MKEFKKICIYFLVEIIYTLLVLLYLYEIELNFSIHSDYELQLFLIVFIVPVIIIWFIGPMLNRYVIFIYSGIYTLYLVSQNIYNRAFHQYYRFSTVSTLLNEAWGARDSAMEFITLNDIIPFIILTAGTIIFILMYFFLQRRCFKLIYRIPYKLLSLLLIIPCMNYYEQYNLLLDNALHQEDLFQMNKTDYYIYETIPNTNMFVEKFGLLPFAYRDLSLFYQNDIASEEDYQMIYNFLSSRNEHKPNEMTGIFEGKNVIFIQAESLIDIAINKELTPTLYKIKNESINIKGFNTPALPGSTSDTEFMSNTSIIPNSEGYAICYKYPFNSYITTLPGIFNELGYNTRAYHNNYGQYYNRDVVFPNWGYDEFRDCTDFGLEDGSTDSEVMEIVKWIYSETNNPYMVYWVTYSGHQPYDLNSVAVSEDDVNKIKKLYPDLDDSYVSYLAKNMDLDRSVKSLMDELRKVKKLDNLVIVLYGDHIVKGLEFGDGSSYYEETGIEYYESATYTDLFIYNSATEGFTYEKTATTLDLLPTIANMWNIDIDYRTILGSDIFDKDYNGFYFSEWEIWQTDNFSYDYINDKIYVKDDYDINIAAKEAHYYVDMKEVAKKILKLDYFEGLINE